MNKKNIIIAVIIVCIVLGAYFLGTQRQQESGNQTLGQNGTKSQKEAGVVEKDIPSKSMGKIAFEASGSIHLIDPDGKNETVLIDGRNPVWAPDGKTISYIGSRTMPAPSGNTDPLIGLTTLNIIDTISKQNKELASCDYQSNCMANASWAPDGKKILFSQEENSGQATLNMMNVDTGELIKLASHDHKDGLYLFDISHDGQKIAYCSNSEHLTIVNMDGTGKEEFQNASCYASDPIDWSPDGRIIITSQEVVKVSEKTTITLPHNYGFALSPDGKKIAYVTTDYAIFTMNIDGTQNTRITDDRTCFEKLCWSPNGKQIAYSGDNAILVVNSDGSEQKKIIDTNDIDTIMAWSPK